MLSVGKHVTIRPRDLYMQDPSFSEVMSIAAQWTFAQQNFQQGQNFL